MAVLNQKFSKETSSECEHLQEQPGTRHLVVDNSLRDNSLRRLLVAATTRCATSRCETTRCSDNSLRRELFSQLKGKIVAA